MRSESAISLDITACRRSPRHLRLRRSARRRVPPRAVASRRRAHGPGEQRQAAAALGGGETAGQVAHVVGEKVRPGLPQRAVPADQPRRACARLLRSPPGRAPIRGKRARTRRRRAGRSSSPPPAQHNLRASRRTARHSGPNGASRRVLSSISSGTRPRDHAEHVAQGRMGRSPLRARLRQLGGSAPRTDPRRPVSRSSSQSWNTTAPPVRGLLDVALDAHASRRSRRESRQANFPQRPRREGPVGVVAAAHPGDSRRSRAGSQPASMRRQGDDRVHLDRGAERQRRHADRAAGVVARPRRTRSTISSDAPLATLG